MILEYLQTLFGENDVDVMRDAITVAVGVDRQSAGDGERKVKLDALLAETLQRGVHRRATAAESGVKAHRLVHDDERAHC